MRFAFCSISLIVASLLSAAPLPKKDKEKDYHAMKLGTKWTYALADDKEKGELVLEVIEDSVQDDKSRKIVMNATAKIDNRDLPKKTHTYRIADGNIEFTAINGRAIPAQKLFQANIKPGDTWSVDPGDKTQIQFVVGEPEEIDVPAGKFKALRITATKKEGDNKMIVSQTWVVDSVGVVKLEADGATQALKAFKAGQGK